MEDVFIEIAEKSGVSFGLGKVVVPAVSSMRSQDIARDLLSLGAITMNIAAPGVFDKVDASDGGPLMAVLFDYAIEVAPRMDGDEDTIDVAGLKAHVGFMRECFGDVEMSPDISMRMGQRAQVAVNLAELAEREAPGNTGESA